MNVHPTSQAVTVMVCSRCAPCLPGVGHNVIPSLLPTFPGDKPATRPEDLVLAPDADGRQRHVRKLDEKLVKR
jgi:hypothetical protein